MTEKQKLFCDEYQKIMNLPRKNPREKKRIAQLWALEKLAKAYTFNYRRYFDPGEEALVEAICTIMSLTADHIQKKAAKILLYMRFGTNIVDSLISDCAVVVDRSDPLVARWRQEVIERDKVCQHCGATENLQVHHISHWPDDPVNRINPDNGILLCPTCHRLEHPELESGLFI